MTTSEEPLLLLSGAGLPPWIWSETRRSLEPEHESRVATRPHREADLAEHVDAALATAPWPRFAVIAHSSGGVIGAELARRAPHRVSSLFCLAAVIPRPGSSFISSMPFPNRVLLSLAMRFAGTRPPDAAIRRGIGAGLDETTIARLIADLVPESIALYRGKVTGGTLPERRGYVVTTRDEELPEALQSRFAANLDPPWREGIATGHLPMLEAPERLAELIGRFLDRPL